MAQEFESRQIEYNKVMFDIEHFDASSKNPQIEELATVKDTVRISPVGGLRIGYRVPNHRRAWDFPALLVEVLTCGDSVVSLETGYDESYRRHTFWVSNKLVSKKTITGILVPLFYDIITGNSQDWEIWFKKLRDARLLQSAK